MPDTIMPSSMQIGEVSKRLNSFWTFYLHTALILIQLSGYGN